jgi:AAA domain
MPQINDKVAPPEMVILIHAPAGAGKSRLAGTLSEHYVERPVGDRPPVVLKDIFWVQLDRDGLLSLQAMGMEPYFLELSAQPENAPVFIDALMSRLKEIPAKMKELGCKWLVVDTFSTLEMYLDTYYLNQDAKNQRSNIQRAYGTSQAVFRTIVMSFKALNCPQLWLCHSRSAYISDLDAQSEMKEAQAKATRPGDYDVALGLTPGNTKFMLNMPSFIFGLESDARGKRSIVTGENAGFYVKNRLGNLLSAREPADLRKLIDKVETIKAGLRSNS